MNGLGLREKAVLASLAMIVLYGIAAVIWFLKMDITSKQGEWYKARRKYHEACQQYRTECKLIAEKREWTEQYESEKAAMPTFAAGMATDTTWLEKVGEIAKKHNVEISSLTPGKEEAKDDVLEMEINCQFEGALESLVKFMHELENTDQGMFDFGSLVFKPSSRRGYLKGSFTVTCAYMRE